MSVWRQKAIACLPECRSEFERPDASVYAVFIEMLPAVVEAHRQNNVDRLTMIYDYAEWCFRQKEKELWNAAGVAFYEHLPDRPETSQSMHRWVKHDIYKEIRELLKVRISDEQLKEIDKSYNYKHQD